MNPSDVDLTTTYLGIQLRSPLVASPSPLTGDVDSARRLAANGVGALVLPSLFEEEIVAEELGLAAALEAGAGVNPEASDYFPPVEGATLADRYLANLQRIKSAVDIPVIASLNATSVGAWSRYAELVAGAGARGVQHACVQDERFFSLTRSGSGRSGRFSPRSGRCPRPRD